MKKISDYPEVSVVVVNYNGKKYLERCFSSLAELDYKKERLEIIMVDNCSTDGSDIFVKGRFPHVKILHNDVNNYCKANNMGIRSSTGEFTAFLNNDAYVDKNWLKELLNIMKTDKRIGCAGSKILFPNGKIQSTGHKELPNFYWEDRGLRKIDKGQYDVSEEMNSLSLSSVLFRRSCLEDAGYLDEDFVMFLEDVDLCLRCRRKGWRIFYSPKSIAYHEFHGTADEKIVNYYIERNRLLLIAKHFPEKIGEYLYFTQDSDKTERAGGIYPLLSQVTLKLIASHEREITCAVMPAVFERARKTEALNKKIKNICDITLEKMSVSLRNKVNECEQDKLLLKQKDKAIEDSIKDKNALLKFLEEWKMDLSKKEEMINILAAEKNCAEHKLIEKIEELNRLKIEYKTIEGDSQKQKLLDAALLKEKELSGARSLIQDIDASIKELKEGFNKKEAENNRLVEKIIGEISEKEAEKNDLIKESRAEMDKKEAEKNDLIKELRAEMDKKDEENSCLVENLRSEINKKETEKNNIAHNLEEEINKVYSSTTYKVIARPLWSFLDMVKLKKGKGFGRRIFANLLLCVIVVLFFILIVIPLKVRKFLKI
jgi:GT2 family glycosyltransferase